MYDAEALSPFPKRIQLQTHTRCNYACPMCPYPEREAERAHERMSDALFDRILAEIAGQPRCVALCLMLQNEPLLDRRFVELVERAHQVTQIETIAAVTNGSALREPLLRRLEALQRFRLTVSVNTNDPKRYLHVHGVSRAPALRELLEAYGGDRDRITVSAVVTEATQDEARVFRAHWRDAGYRVRLLPYMTRIGDKSADGRLHDYDAEYGHCIYPLQTLPVLADGRVILCCQDWRHDRVFGDLSRQSIAEVWRSEELKQYRCAALAGTLRSQPACAGCDYPMRASERRRLDRSVEVHGATPARSGTVAHASFVAVDGCEPVPVAVHAIYASQRRVGLAADVPLREGACRLLIAIGHTAGAFVLDGLADVWCDGVLREAGARDGVILYRFEASDARGVDDLLRWYEADWRGLSDARASGVFAGGVAHG